MGTIYRISANRQQLFSSVKCDFLQIFLELSLQMERQRAQVHSSMPVVSPRIVLVPNAFQQVVNRTEQNNVLDGSVIIGRQDAGVSTALGGFFLVAKLNLGANGREEYLRGLLGLVHSCYQNSSDHINGLDNSWRIGCILVS